LFKNNKYTKDKRNYFYVRGINMRILDEVLAFNESFVEKKEYEKYEKGKLPRKRMAIVSCMDTRLVELLPKAMDIGNGDVKLIKTAGALISSRYGSAMRSVLVAVYELGADEVYVIGHYDCGMMHLNADKMIEKMKKRGVQEDVIETVNYNVNLNEYLSGFDSVEDGVRFSVDLIKNHPLMPKDTPIHGLIIDPNTGKLDLVINGYES
jgi:carbonic anhydrase